MTVPALGKTEQLKPEKLAIEMGKAHGLLYAFDSLYVMVNENGKDNGLFRLQDTNGDDQYDKTTKLHTMAGGGEHGLHSMIVSPNGKRIYFNCPKAWRKAAPPRSGARTTSCLVSGMRTATLAASWPPAVTFAA
jgi:hypothetical protein